MAFAFVTICAITAVLVGIEVESVLHRNLDNKENSTAKQESNISMSTEVFYSINSSYPRPVYSTSTVQSAFSWLLGIKSTNVPISHNVTRSHESTYTTPVPMLSKSDIDFGSESSSEMALKDELISDNSSMSNSEETHTVTTASSTTYTVSTIDDEYTTFIDRSSIILQSIFSTLLSSKSTNVISDTRMSVSDVPLSEIDTVESITPKGSTDKVTWEDPEFTSDIYRNLFDPESSSIVTRADNMDSRISGTESASTLVGSSVVTTYSTNEFTVFNTMEEENYSEIPDEFTVTATSEQDDPTISTTTNQNREFNTEDSNTDVPDSTLFSVPTTTTSTTTFEFSPETLPVSTEDHVPEYGTTDLLSFPAFTTDKTSTTVSETNSDFSNYTVIPPFLSTTILSKLNTTHFIYNKTDAASVVTSETSPTSSSVETSFPPPPVSNGNAGLIMGIISTILIIGVLLTLWLMYRKGKLIWPQVACNHVSSGGIQPPPILLKQFPAHFNEMLDIPSRLSHEYQLLATLSADIYEYESFIAGQQPDNKYKNRYVNILPYDSTRVKLDYDGEDYVSDYINASYIKGYTHEIEYIASQGPKEETCHDFWLMIYQQAVKVIVMVTQLEEQGKIKCYKYFPNLRQNLQCGDMTICCTTELHFVGYTSRTLTLVKDNRKRFIVHLHFREWPDFGCPSSPKTMLQFCQVVRHHSVLSQPGITLVHCSAGVGRTGTLIAIDILLQHIKENKKIDIFGTVYNLRKQRVNMVQSQAQYVYLYKCIKEALEDPSLLSNEKYSSSSNEPIYENVSSARHSLAHETPVDTNALLISECSL